MSKVYRAESALLGEQESPMGEQESLMGEQAKVYPCRKASPGGVCPRGKRAWGTKKLP